MKIDTNEIATATEANQNFSRVARMAEKKGRVVIFKNNRPKLLVAANNRIGVRHGTEQTQKRA